MSDDLARMADELVQACQRTVALHRGEAVPGAPDAAPLLTSSVDYRLTISLGPLGGTPEDAEALAARLRETGCRVLVDGLNVTPVYNPAHDPVLQARGGAA